LTFSALAFTASGECGGALRYKAEGRGFDSQLAH